MLLCVRETPRERAIPSRWGCTQCIHASSIIKRYDLRNYSANLRTKIIEYQEKKPTYDQTMKEVQLPDTNPEKVSKSSHGGRARVETFITIRK